MKKNKSFSILGTLFFCLLILFSTTTNTSKLTKISLINFEQKNNEFKYISLDEIDLNQVNFDDLRALSKTEEYTIFEQVSNQNYYVLNNLTGKINKQEEMSNLNMNLYEVGYDEDSNYFHYIDDNNQNYYFNPYENDGNNKDEFIISNNNYKYNENVNMVLSQNSSYKANKGKHEDWYINVYTEDMDKEVPSSTHNNLISIDFIHDNNVQSGPDFIDQNGNKLSFEDKHFIIKDNLAMVNVSYDLKHSDPEKHTFVMDLESKKWVKMDYDDRVWERLNGIKGKYYFFNDYLIFNKDEVYSKEEIKALPKHYFNSSNLYNEIGMLTYKINNTVYFKNDSENNYLINFDYKYNNNSAEESYYTIYQIDDYGSNIKESDDGSYYYISSKGTLKQIDNNFHYREFNEEKVDYTNIYLANEQDLILKDNQNNFYLGNIFSYIGITFNKEIDYFFDQSIDDRNIYLKDKPWISIENNSINYVYINGEKIDHSVDNYHSWYIDLNDKKYEDENEFKLKVELKSGYDQNDENNQTYTLSINIVEDYMPQIKVYDFYQEKKYKKNDDYSLDRYVYYDPNYDENEGLVDGYYSNNQKILEINDFFVDKYFINGQEITGTDAQDIENGQYILDFSNNEKINIKIIDKFGYEWNYMIYNENPPKKYWTETNQGKSNYEKAKRSGYSEKELNEANANESYFISKEVENLADKNKLLIEVISLIVIFLVLIVSLVIGFLIFKHKKKEKKILFAETNENWILEENIDYSKSDYEDENNFITEINLDEQENYYYKDEF